VVCFAIFTVASFEDFRIKMIKKDEKAFLQGFFLVLHYF